MKKLWLLGGGQWMGNNWRVSLKKKKKDLSVGKKGEGRIKGKRKNKQRR